MLRSLQRGSVGRRLVAASLVAVAGCDDGDIISAGPTVDNILFDIVPHVIDVGARAQATAQAIGTNGLIIESSRVRVTFSSRNAAVATVDATTGTITGVSPGRTAIVAEARGQSATDTVQVVAR
jgi:hypothetical protein